MSSPYFATNWYWTVGTGPANNVYSSAAAAFVPTSNATYVEWLAQLNQPTVIPTQADLIWVFSNAGCSQCAAGLSGSD
jgi:hypothetical protein